VAEYSCRTWSSSWWITSAAGLRGEAGCAMACWRRERGRFARGEARIGRSLASARTLLVALTLAPHSTPHQLQHTSAHTTPSGYRAPLRRPSPTRAAVSPISLVLPFDPSTSPPPPSSRRFAMGEAQQNRPEDLDDRCLAKYGVLDNRFGQNPCEVARVLLDMCSPRAYYSLPALDLVNNQTHYPSPNPGQVRPSSSSSLREPLNLVERELTSVRPRAASLLPAGDRVPVLDGRLQPPARLRGVPAGSAVRVDPSASCLSPSRTTASSQCTVEALTALGLTLSLLARSGPTGSRTAL